MNKPLLKDCPFIQKAVAIQRACGVQKTLTYKTSYINRDNEARRALRALEELADLIESHCVDLRSHIDGHKKEKFEYTRER